MGVLGECGSGVRRESLCWYWDEKRGKSSNARCTPRIVLCAVLLAACPARAAEVQVLETEWMAGQSSVLHLQAEEGVLKREKGLLPLTGPGGSAAADFVRERLCDALARSSLLRSSKHWAQTAADLERREIRPELVRSENAWRGALRRELDSRRRWLEVTAMRGGAPDRPASLWPSGTGRIRLLLWVEVALTVGLLLAVLEIRRPRRPRWRSPSWAALAAGWGVGLGVAALLGFHIAQQTAALIHTGQPLVGGDPTAQAEEDYRQFLQGQLRLLADYQEGLRLQNEAMRKEIDAERERVESAWASRLGFSDGRAFRARAGDLLAVLHPVLVRAQLALTIAEDAAQREAETAERQRQTEQALEGADLVVRQRAAVASGLYVAATLGMCVPWLAVRRRRTEDSRCPRCGGGLRSDRGGRACKACSYRLSAVHRGAERMVFSVAGATGSGKTRWLREFSRLLARHQVPALVELVDGDQPADEGSDFLQFHFRDGASAALVHLVDGVGGGTGREGLLLFLDPTWPYHPDAPRLDPQQRVLEGAIAAMRQMHKVAVGGVVPAAAAVCLGKLDLLPTRSLFDGAAHEWLDRLRGADAERIGIEVLQKRSALVREALPVVFPGWNLPQLLETAFGDNVCYFPTGPVGLSDEEATPAFGIAEPVLWLLWMHGYRVVR